MKYAPVTIALQLLEKIKPKINIWSHEYSVYDCKSELCVNIAWLAQKDCAGRHTKVMDSLAKFSWIFT